MHRKRRHVTPRETRSLTDTNMRDKAAWIGIDWSATPPQISIADISGSALPLPDLVLTGLDDLGAALAGQLPNELIPPVFCAGLPLLPATTLRPVPAMPMEGLLRLQSDDPQLALYAIPGLCQRQPADLSQGAETVIAGYLDTHPDFDGILCCVGARAHWAHISAREVVSFQSSRTPDLLGHLAQDTGPVDQPAFLGAIDDIMARPQILATALSRIDAERALNSMQNAAAEGRLAGLLIGLELAATRPYWLGQRVVVLADGTLGEHYLAALQAQGADAALHGRQEALHAGFHLAWQRLPKG